VNTTSKLDAALQLTKHGLRLFPIIPNSKNPAVKKFYDVATTDEKQLSVWFETKKFNVGISTDGLLVVDVDHKNGKDGFKSIKELRAEGKILPKTLQQKTPSGTIHLIYRAPFAIANSASKVGIGLDIRGHHGYVVGAGSLIDGKAYSVLVDHPIADAPNWLIEAAEAFNEGKSHAQEIAVDIDSNIAWERGKELLNALPLVESGVRNVEAYKVANKLKDEGVNQNDSFALMLEYWKCEPLLEYEELAQAVRSAFTYGKEAQGSKSPEAVFGNLGEGAKVDSKPNPILALNAEYAFVKMGGKFSILHETTGPDGAFIAEFLEENTFHAFNAAKTFTADGKAAQPITKLWMKHPERRTFDSLVFKPEVKVDPRFYNLWRGFGVKELHDQETVTDAMKRAYDAFTSHIFDNVANGNSDHYDWVMTWFAHMVQRPWEKPGTALVLRGKKGVGKNAIFETFRNMFPNHYLVSGDRRYLVSNFNAHLERLLLFVADEAFWSGDKASESVLKSLITDRRLVVERKGKEALNIESNHRIAILGNDNWVVPASHDERRYAIFDMGETRKQDRTFFGGLERDMRLGGTRYLFTQLRKMDIDGIDIGKIPNTTALAKQKLKSLGLVEQWWHDALLIGYLEHTSFDDWKTTIPFAELKDSFRRYAGNRGRGSWLDSDEAFLSTLKAVSTDVQLQRGGVIKMPTLDQARIDWDAHLSSKTDWI
jgi:hypothetical protein